MPRSCLLLAFALLLPACATERRVIVDNSPTAKFAALMSGQTTTSDGTSAPSTGAWQVQHNDVPGQNKPVSEQARRIAELLRAQAANPNAPRPTLSDPGTNSGWNITTNFEGAEPIRPAPSSPTTPNAPTAPPTSPFAAPMNTAAPNISATPTR
jgi:hypothetical protein